MGNSWLPLHVEAFWLAICILARRTPPLVLGADRNPQLHKCHMDIATLLLVSTLICVESKKICESLKAIPTYYVYYRSYVQGHPAVVLCSIRGVVLGVGI